MSTPRLKKIVASIVETRAELEFQVRRLADVKSDIDTETAHLADLKDGYENAHHYLGILLNYQQGRLNRESTRNAMEQANDEG